MHETLPNGVSVRWNNAAGGYRGVDFSRRPLLFVPVWPESERPKVAGQSAKKAGRARKVANRAVFAPGWFCRHIKKGLRPPIALKPIRHRLIA